MTPRVKEILSWYGADNPGTLANLARLLGHGRLGGTGRLVILPVDQGFEHGPARSFAPNPPAYDPRYHFELAIEAGCNAYAAPLGFIEAAIGFTIYPGSSRQYALFSQARALAAEAKALGLAVVVWSYPRGSQLSEAGETAIDVVAYAAQIAAQLGAHIIKVKLPSDHVEQPAAKAVYEKEKIPISTAAERVAHVVQSAFAGRRIVIFSGGAANFDDGALHAEFEAIRDGGGFGSIVGRNSFQRPRPDALKMLNDAMTIYGARP